ncbi:MAG: undecaprenyl-diphosphate phosphatase [Candidatus Altiarchaeales archaeon]|nr:MAG: undecaprenyl-diphosphate phosphatase [Candidatus Altiarchaeales archaeon]
MELTDFLILGILQGVTEWLPVSSSGQSMLAMIDILSIRPEIALKLAIYLHIGSLLAVIVKFRKDIMKSLSKFKEDKLFYFVIFSTIFTGVVGIPIYMGMKSFLKLFTKKGEIITIFIGIFLIITGLVLYISKRRFGTRRIKNIKIKDMVISGIAQGFTIIPGISRSGITVSVLLLLGFEQDIALKLSFLMSIPAVIGAVFIESIQGDIITFDIFDIYGIFVGIFVAFITGYMTIEGLIKFSKRVRFDTFCIIFGLLTIILTIIFILL